MKIYIPLIVLLFSLLFACNGGQTPTPTNDQPLVDTLINTMGSSLIEALSKKIAATPANASLYVERGAIFYDKENYPAAIKDLQKAISIDSSNFLHHHLLADALLDNYQSEKAIEVLEKYSASHPKRFQTLLKLSEFQLILRQHEASLETIDKLLQQSPKNAEGFYMLGRNYKEMGDTARAINAFQTTVEENPDHLDAYVELGILFDNKNNKIAPRYFDNALRIDSTNFDALFGKAWFYHQRNEYVKANKAYQRTSHFHPKESRVHFNHGILYLELSELYKEVEKKKEANQEALKKFDLATKVDPSYGNAYYYLGLTAERLGDKKRAIRNYQQAAALMPDNNAPRRELLRLGEKLLK